MSARTTLLGGAAAGALLAFSLASAALADGVESHHRHHRHHEAVAAPPAGPGVREEVDSLKAEIDALKAQQEQQGAAQAQTQAQLQQLQSQLADANARADRAEAQVQAQIETIPGEVQTEAAKYKPKTDKIYYKGVTLTLNGFAAAESVYRTRNDVGDIGSNYSKIPYDNSVLAHEGETRLTARQSRVSFLAEGAVTPTTIASFYGEFDFLADAQTGNSNESNSYSPRIRHLYGAVDWNDAGWHLLAGQNWSLVTMNGKGITPRNEVIPPTIEAQYVPGFVWARQPQIRITKDFADKQVWVAVSAENPQTTIGGAASGTGTAYSGVTPNYNNPGVSLLNNVNSFSLNSIPDVVGKVAVEPIIGGARPLHAEVFGLVKQAYDRVDIAPAATNQAGMVGLGAGNVTDTSWGGGVGGGVTLAAAPKLLDLQVSGLVGKGIGRYGSGQLPDAIVGPDGSLDLIHEYMIMAGATLHATPDLDLYAFGGAEDESALYQNPTVGGKVVPLGYGDPLATLGNCFVELGSCSPDTHQIDQYTVGLWDKLYTGPFGQVRVGLQFSHTELHAFPGLAGTNTAGFLPGSIVRPTTDDNMLFTSFRYYPF